jgi:hypothetical protein
MMIHAHDTSKALLSLLASSLLAATMRLLSSFSTSAKTAVPMAPLPIPAGTPICSLASLQDTGWQGPVAYRPRKKGKNQ